MTFKEYNCPVCGQHFSQDVLNKDPQKIRFMVTSPDDQIDLKNIATLKTFAVTCGKCNYVMLFNGKTTDDLQDHK